MKKWLRISKRFFISVLLGMVLSVYLLQNTQRSHEYILNFVHNQFEEQWNSSFEGRIKFLDLFRLQLVFEDVAVYSLDEKREWSWKAGFFTLSGSLWNMIREGSLGVHIDLEHLEVRSVTSGLDLDIGPHLSDLFFSYERDVSIAIKTVTIKDGYAHVASRSGYCADMWWNSDYQNDAGDERSHFYITQAKLYSDLLMYIGGLSGSVQLHTDEALHLFTDLRFKNLYSDTADIPYFLTGSWEHGKGSWSLTSLSGACALDTISVEKKDNQYTFSGDGSLETRLIYPLLGTSQDCSVALDGECEIREAHLKHLKGLLIAKNVGTTYGNMDEFRANFNKNQQRLHGDIVTQKDQYGISGSWEWDLSKKQGNISLNNEKMAAIPQSYWIILPQKLDAQCAFDDQGAIDARWNCVCSHEKLETSVVAEGSLKADRDTFAIQGYLGETSFDVAGITRFPYIQHAQCSHNGQKRIMASIDQQNLSASIDYTYIHQFLPENWKRHMIGQGTVQFDGQLTKEKTNGLLQLRDGIIHVPTTDNFIDRLSCLVDLDVQQKKLVVSDCVTGFHHGKITSSRMTFFFDQWGIPTFINAPIIIDNLFANWGKHCSSLFSGSVNVAKTDEKCSLEGAIFMDESRINQSFLSEQMQRIFAGASPFLAQSLDNWQVDCQCITRNPIIIDTSLCKTTCTIDVHAYGLLRNPDVTGLVSLVGGQFYFPYKSLNITKARLRFPGQKWHDAIIELYAKNRIKRYQVQMHVSGSVAKPQVDFTAEPTLNQEQILALLLGGSEKGALSTSVPAIVLHNAYSWLFGLSGDSAQDGVLKRFMRSLHHIRFVPTVSKKGLKGALEIDLTDKVHASIGKDFANREQASLELEYQLNNALSLRGRRDERGDMGADVEVRWKF